MLLFSYRFISISITLFLLLSVQSCVFSKFFIFVPKDTIKILNNKYRHQYITTQKLDIGNNQYWNKGKKIWVSFQANKHFIAVYGVLITEDKEKVLGQNIYIFLKGDFPDKVFDLEFLESKLAEIIKLYRKVD